MTGALRAFPYLLPMGALLLGCCNGKPVSVGAAPSASASPLRATEVTPPTAAPLVAPATAGAAAPPAAAPVAPPVVDWPLRWSDERAALTLAYRRLHQAADAADLRIEPRVIVLHYTGGGSAKGTKAYFDEPTMEAARSTLAKAGKVNVSSHFLVDRDGTIYQLQPETRFARHCIGLNHVAIGVENVGDEARWPLTDAQVAANAALVRDLTHRFPITHLLGHHEVMKFRANPYFVELDPAYRNRKRDPGARFLAAVRALLPDLDLAGLAL